MLRLDVSKIKTLDASTLTPRARSNPVIYSHLTPAGGSPTNAGMACREWFIGLSLADLDLHQD